jgi:cation diffusion facilitator CzcD-associated flavoprotein CzcO
VGFLEALVAPNVTTFLDGLKTITPEGFLDPTGHEHKADVIILATGFNTTWIPRFPVIANGVNLQDLYSKRPVSYLGVAAPQMPNYFTFYGPYGPLAAGSALPTIELFTFYIIDMLRKMQVEHIKSYTPRARVIDDFDRHAQLFLKRTVWSANCRSWFKGGQSKGRIMVYPGTRNQ